MKTVKKAPHTPPKAVVPPKKKAATPAASAQAIASVSDPVTGDTEVTLYLNGNLEDNVGSMTDAVAFLSDFSQFVEDDEIIIDLVAQSPSPEPPPVHPPPQ